MCSKSYGVFIWRMLNMNLGDIMERVSEREFEFLIKRVVQRFLSKKYPNEKDIEDVFEKLKQKAKTATKLSYLDTIGRYSKKAYNHVSETNRDKNDFAWKKHSEVDQVINKRYQELRTSKKSFRIKISGLGEYARTEEKKTLCL